MTADIWTWRAIAGGKYHARKNPVTSVALCRGTTELDTSLEAPVIAVQPGRPSPPIVCKKCMTLAQGEVSL